MGLASLFIKKKVKRDVGNFGVLTLIMIAVFAIAVFSTNVFSDDVGTFAHTPEITLSPNIANCNQDLQTQFTVSINNTGGYGIYNVKIYKAPPNINSLSCGLAPSGWNSLGFQFGLYCEYVTDPQASNTIDAGESLNFTFDASVNQSDCKSTFRITTLDNEAIVTGSGNGTEVNTYRDLRVDCSEPKLEKMVGEPKIECDVDGCDYWITNNTEIEFWAFDNETADKCNTGIDYCKWEVLVDGSDSIYSGRNDTDANETHWPLHFNEDSNHEITAICYDKAGNPSNEIIELDKVDITPPETNKSFNGPKKIENGVEWIDGVTTVTLASSDPDPTGNMCAIGVDKIWYANILSPAEDICWPPQQPYQQRCSPPLPSPYDKKAFPELAQCINDMQDYCTNNCSFPHEVGVNWACDTFHTWEECVEGSVHEQCKYKGFDPRWHLYNGTPIEKDEESCHILQFFAVDDLGNVEGMNTNCFFVDKTPPNLTKDNGQAILDFDRGNFLTEQNPKGEFHWITQNMSVKFTCEDQQPHPSGDVKLCYKVSYDYPQWRYITEQYCDALNEDGYCCVQQDAEEGILDFDFSFKEDSMHNLEYYCEDAVGKKTDVHTQYYKVDTAAPNITKRMFGNWLGQCPPEPDSNDTCYVADNGESGISVSVEDLGPICAVDRVSCLYEVYWHTDRETCEDKDGQPQEDGTCLIDSGAFGSQTDIIFSEDSTHDLKITCSDALGNGVNETETFLVDSTPPKTEKTYGKPFFDNDIYHWINTSTPVIFNSIDNKVGVQNITWRNTLLHVPDEACFVRCQFEGEGEWNEIDGDNGTIFKQEESCHLIEFYATDKLNNREDMQRQCVFVDNTGPEVIKEVGEPAVKCDPEEEDCDYYITQNTEISLRCVDGGQHPVDHATLFYRDYLENESAPEYTEKEEGSAVVTKKEDSRHVLEAYCVDALGNQGPLDREIFVVESQAPEIKKTIVGPWYGACPPEADSEDECFIDGVTNISVEVVDPDPHPVNDVQCRWAYTVNNGDPIFGGQGLGSSFIVHFPEESRHRLIIECQDGLGNRVHDEEQFIVDKTPPVTTKRYGEPIIINQEIGEEWISNNTQIWLSAYDPEPHPSGVNATWYRNTLVDEQYCRNQELCQQVSGGDAPWELWTGEPKYKNQESCHLIEYFSVDNVEKTERVNKQCAYVDLSAPEPNKTVGAPKTKWDGIDSVFYPEETKRCWDGTGNEIECWKITLDTPITLDCKETGPHPVGKEKVYFQVDFDGDDITEEYCNSDEVQGQYNITGNGYCFVDGTEAPFTFHFNEESEHNLKFYCEDALGNVGPVDEEKFKVEGRQFKIKINKKWNLISIPFVLTDNNISKVFESIAENIEVVWTYEARNGTSGEWLVFRPGNESTSTLFEIHPGHGYWILAKNDDELVIGGSLFSPGAVTPPARELEPGWNLIGYYGNENEEGGRDISYSCPEDDGKSAFCALQSLVEPASGFGNPRWSALVTYCEEDNPNLWKQLGLNDNMAPGAGYWLFLKTSAADPEEDYLYGPSTTCGFGF